MTAVKGQGASWRLRLASALVDACPSAGVVALLSSGSSSAQRWRSCWWGPTPNPLRQQGDPRQRADADVDATPQISLGPQESLLPQESHGPQVAHPGLLAYTQDGDVYMANPDGSGATLVVHDPGVAFSAPTWSPDARWRALRGGEGLCVRDAGTLALRRLADGLVDLVPDNQSLALVSSSTTGEPHRLKSRRVPLRAAAQPGRTRLRQVRRFPDGGDRPGGKARDARDLFAPPQHDIDVAAIRSELARIEDQRGALVARLPLVRLRPARRLRRQSPLPELDRRRGRRAYDFVRDHRSGEALVRPRLVAGRHLDRVLVGHVGAFATEPGPGPTVRARWRSFLDGRDLHALEVASYGTTFTWNADASAVEFWDLDTSKGWASGVEVGSATGEATRRPCARPGRLRLAANAGAVTVPALPSVSAATSVRRRPCAVIAAGRASADPTGRGRASRSTRCATRGGSTSAR